PTLVTDLDNGQHILLGAYTATLALMSALGLRPDELFHRMPLFLAAADGSFEFKAPRISAPLNLLIAVLRAKGVSYSERWSLLTDVAHLRAGGWNVAPGATVGDWLVQRRQSGSMIDVFWRPLCVAALNTPIESACGQLFANV